LTLTCKRRLFARMILRMIIETQWERIDGVIDRMEAAAGGTATCGGLLLRSRAGSLLGGRPAFDCPSRRLHGRYPRRRACGKWRTDRRRPGAHHRLFDYRSRDRMAASWRRWRSARAYAWLRSGNWFWIGPGAREDRSPRARSRLLESRRSRRTRRCRWRRGTHAIPCRAYRREAGVCRLLGVRSG